MKCYSEDIVARRKNKKINGVLRARLKSQAKREIELELIKIKDYPRYGLYQVYKLVNGKRMALYKTCYTKLQLIELAKKKYFINEEVFE